MDGLEVLAEIIPEHSDIPVIIVTGMGSEDVAVRALKGGAADYIIKSTDYLKTLPLSIKENLEKYNLKREKARLERELKAKNIELEEANKRLARYAEQLERENIRLKKQLEIEPGAEEDMATELKYPLEAMHCYLIKEKKPAHSFEVFKELVTHGYQGLCISRTHPELIRKRYGLKRTPVLWLSTSEYEHAVSPTNRAHLFGVIDAFIEKSAKSVILLDGLEYLISKNSYEKILDFVEDLTETIIMNKSCLIIPVDPEALTPRELALLEREMTPLPWFNTMVMREGFESTEL
jgi:CheY-like chemotaxis protein